MRAPAVSTATLKTRRPISHRVSLPAMPAPSDIVPEIPMTMRHGTAMASTTIAPTTAFHSEPKRCGNTGAIAAVPIAAARPTPNSCRSLRSYTDCARRRVDRVAEVDQHHPFAA